MISGLAAGLCLSSGMTTSFAPENAGAAPVTFAAVAGAASGECVWDNLPSGVISVNGHSSQRDEVSPFRSGAADDFIAGACLPAQPTVVIGSVQWWGRVFNPGSPANTTSFEVNFYFDDGGQPTGAGMENPRSTAVATFDVPFGAVSVALIGTDLYQYQYIFPAGQEPVLNWQGHYWLEIVSVGTFPPQWGMCSTADDQTLAVAVQGFPQLGQPYWTTIAGRDLAFRLLLSGADSDPAPLDFVTVGSPGNPADERYEAPGHGAVGYEYAIARYEVTAAQYCAFLNAVAAADPYGLYSPEMWDSSNGCRIERLGAPGSYTYEVSSVWGDRPVNYVSWSDAVRFANWLENGKPAGPQGPATTEAGAYFVNGATEVVALQTVQRQPGANYVIPTSDEWYKAAYHWSDGQSHAYLDYPLQGEGLPSNDVLSPDPGNNANFYRDGFTLGAPYWRTRVGEFENSTSHHGTYDQAGNVWEWTETPHDWSNRVARGGSYLSFDSHLRPTARLTLWNIVEDDELGFRVARLTTAVAGDVDGDCDVDLDDLLLVLGAFGAGGGGDADADGDTDLDDLLAVLGGYGSSC